VPPKAAGVGLLHFSFSHYDKLVDKKANPRPFGPPPSKEGGLKPFMRLPWPLVTEINFAHNSVVAKLKARNVLAK